MSTNYLIGIGGTGARCLEAVIYLAAIGLFSEPLHILMIDPDQSNGNANRTKEIITIYQQLHQIVPPVGATLLKRRHIWSSDTIPIKSYTLFKASVNESQEKQLMYFWKDPNHPDLRFSETINYITLSDKLRDFVDLFYEKSDLDMELGKGYRGRPNVGSVTLSLALSRTTKMINKDAEDGFAEESVAQFIKSLRNDLQVNQAKVFIFGSVFGGTGAAGLPIIPKILRELCPSNSANLKFGCALMAPYFTFQSGNSQSKEGPSPDPDRHMIATQAALLHYANSLSNYNDTYLVGAPKLIETSKSHKDGGDKQQNDPHYAEIIAALAARDFFDIVPGYRQLHYLDGDYVRWSTLPALKERAEDRTLIKHRILVFTTLAYFYQKIFYKGWGDRSTNSSWYTTNKWYGTNYLKLEQCEELLATINKMFSNYLNWLLLVGKSVDMDTSSFFNWNHLAEERTEQNKLLIGQLMKTDVAPIYAQNGYDMIMKKLNATTINPISDHTGVVLHLFYYAISEFCKENYAYEMQSI